MLKGTIYICDDEEEILRYLSKVMKAAGLAVSTFTSGRALLRQMERSPGECDLLLLDIRMPDLDGLQVLKLCRELRPDLTVIFMTAYGTIDSAVEAIKLGAYDYVTKPFPREKILGMLENVLERERLVKENRAFKENLHGPVPDHLVFTSQKFRAVYDTTLQVAASDANFLILGESGTGKELIASAVHDNSPRRGKRFISINCAVLTESLLESQLFGHVRGAFTGAVTTHRGLLEEADGGTLFLDEIGDMSLAIQAKLLRVIQERDFIPVGATKAKKVDIRFVAATNKDLEREVRAGRFREDLFYRLNVISIHLPSLRERPEDIEPLARYFLRKYGQRMTKEVTGFTLDALKLLMTYSWPGNIRELGNVIERAVILAPGPLISTDLLPMENSGSGAGPRQGTGMASLESLEREHIRNILLRTGFHKSRSAEILGISRKTLDRKISEYGLDKYRIDPDRENL